METGTKLLAAPCAVLYETTEFQTVFPGSVDTCTDTPSELPISYVCRNVRVSVVNPVVLISGDVVSVELVVAAPKDAASAIMNCVPSLFVIGKMPATNPLACRLNITPPVVVPALVNKVPTLLKLSLIKVTGETIVADPVKLTLPGKQIADVSGNPATAAGLAIIITDLDTEVVHPFPPVTV